MSSTVPMYHSHHDEMTQMALGVMGLMIIHPRRPTEPQPDRDFAFLRMGIKPGAFRPDPRVFAGFNMLTLNARAFQGTEPMVAKRGQRVRIRLVNLPAMKDAGPGFGTFVKALRSGLSTPLGPASGLPVKFSPAEHHMEGPMQLSEVHDYARQFLSLHGDKARIIAAQRCIESEKRGHPKEAEDWRRICDALAEMRGPHVS